MNKQIPELSFVDIEKGDSKAINILSNALEDHGFFSITEHGLSNELVDKLSLIHISEPTRRI